MSRAPRSGSRRKAAPHPLAARQGRAVPVTVTLIWRGGAEGWVEIRSSQGRWYRPFSHCIGGLVEELVQGGHMVSENPDAARARRRVEARRESRGHDPQP